MVLDILTAASINGIITPARGKSSLGLFDVLDVPAEVIEFARATRRRYDAVMVGTNTVQVDNPMLTSHALPGQPCARVTLDPEGRIPRHYRIFDGSARTVVGVSSTTPRGYLEFLAARGVEAVCCGERRVDLPVFAAALAGRGLSKVLVEGGGRLSRALLDHDLVCAIHLVLLPIVLDSSAVNLFEGGPLGLGRLRLVRCDRVEDYLLLRYVVTRSGSWPVR
ncbi:MAG: RibD family protein [Acidobacteriota bacterium]|nr:RibD family protein [Acidobacteriota bacterium]